LLGQVAAQLDMIESWKQRSDISACVEILAGIRFGIETIRQFLREDIMKESVVYQEIIREGLQQGIQ
jgi:predicted transposase YdaD